MGCTGFSCSPTCGHLGCSHHFAVTNNTAMNKYVHIFWYAWRYSFRNWFLEPGLTDWKVNACFFIECLVECFIILVNCSNLVGKKWYLSIVLMYYFSNYEQLWAFLFKYLRASFISFCGELLIPIFFQKLHVSKEQFKECLRRVVLS